MVQHYVRTLRAWFLRESRMKYQRKYGEIEDTLLLLIFYFMLLSFLTLRVTYYRLGC